MKIPDTYVKPNVVLFNLECHEIIILISKNVNLKIISVRTAGAEMRFAKALERR